MSYFSTVIRFHFYIICKDTKKERNRKLYYINKSYLHHLLATSPPLYRHFIATLPPLRSKVAKAIFFDSQHFCVILATSPLYLRFFCCRKRKTANRTNKSIAFVNKFNAFVNESYAFTNNINAFTARTRGRFKPCHFPDKRRRKLLGNTYGLIFFRNSSSTIISYFSNSEFLLLNSGTMRFIIVTISGMLTSRLSFSSLSTALTAS